MWQNQIEIILARQLASYLAMPVFIVDTEGNLLYYNEPAEIVLGRRFEETGEMSASEWSTVFEQSELDGSPIPAQEVPLMVALTTRRPAHRRMAIKGLDGVTREIEVAAIPLAVLGDRFLGAMSIFWEVGQ